MVARRSTTFKDLPCDQQERDAAPEQDLQLLQASENTLGVSLGVSLPKNQASYIAAFNKGKCPLFLVFTHENYGRYRLWLEPLGRTSCQFELFVRSQKRESFPFADVCPDL